MQFGEYRPRIWIRCLCALVVAEQGSLRRAAAAVSLSWSTITRRVSARIFAWRAAHPLSKGGAESAGRFVADLRCYLVQRAAPVKQCLLCECHPPAQEIFHRGSSHRFREASGKDRT